MDDTCKGCGQQMQQLHPLTGLCWGCHEIHNEDGPYHDDEDYDEVTQMSYFGCVNNTIRVRSGHYFDLANPKADDVRIEDIAGALSKICRFGGQIDRFYSVAEHSVMCALIAERDGRSADCIMAVLLHDAAEAYVGDCVKPLKVMLPQFKAIESAVELAIEEAFGVNFTAWKKEISDIDHAMLIAERKQFFTSDSVEWTGEKEARQIFVKFWGHEPAAAEHLFMTTYERIKALPF